MPIEAFIYRQGQNPSDKKHFLTCHPGVPTIVAHDLPNLGMNGETEQYLLVICDESDKGGEAYKIDKTDFDRFHGATEHALRLGRIGSIPTKGYLGPIETEFLVPGKAFITLTHQTDKFVYDPESGKFTQRT